MQLAAASKAVIIGFHTQIESHAESLLKQLGVQVRLHDIIYHAIDDVKALMSGLLDKIAQETEKGKAEVKATIQILTCGIIAGCRSLKDPFIAAIKFACAEIKRYCGKELWPRLNESRKMSAKSQKGLECGIVSEQLSGYP